MFARFGIILAFIQGQAAGRPKVDTKNTRHKLSARRLTGHRSWRKAHSGPELRNWATRNSVIILNDRLQQDAAWMRPAEKAIHDADSGIRTEKET
jgi:hypothetical protein